MPKSKEVISSSGLSGSDDSDAPTTKKRKKSAKPAKKSKAKKESDTDSSSDETSDKPMEKPKKNEDGAFMFELGQMKYATVSEFKGKVYVGVREYFFKDTKLCPGKKGITMNMEQWKRFKDNIDNINQALKEY